MRLLSILCFLLLGAALVDADTATFKVVKGKVDYRLPGMSWSPATPGLTVPAGAFISTGFRSFALINLEGSRITVRPLTRLKIQSLSKHLSGAHIRLFLLAGRVHAEVKQAEHRSDNLFTVSGPSATASVRGTGFDFDGKNLLVNHGQVKLNNTYGISMLVNSGEFSSMNHNLSVSQPILVASPNVKGSSNSPSGKDQLTDTLTAYGNTLVQPITQQSIDNSSRIVQTIKTAIMVPPATLTLGVQ